MSLLKAGLDPSGILDRRVMMPDSRDRDPQRLARLPRVRPTGGPAIGSRAGDETSARSIASRRTP